MSQITESKNTANESIDQYDAESCFCDKQKCLIGIASIVIGIGGFILANLLQADPHLLEFELLEHFMSTSFKIMTNESQDYLIGYNWDSFLWKYCLCMGTRLFVKHPYGMF